MVFSVSEWLIAGGTAILGLLMASSIPYRDFKELDLRHSYSTLVFMIFAIALIILEPEVTLFMLFVIYCGSGPLEWVWRRRTGRELELVEVTSSQPNEGHV